MLNDHFEMGFSTLICAKYILSSVPCRGGKIFPAPTSISTYDYGRKRYLLYIITGSQGEEGGGGGGGNFDLKFGGKETVAMLVAL